MSAPVHRTSERDSATALAAARQRREEGRTGSSSRSGTSAEQAFLGLQSSAGEPGGDRHRAARQGQEPGADRG